MSTLLRALRHSPVVLALCVATSAASAATAPLMDVVNAAATTSGPGSLLRAQVLLDRAYFSPGEIDGQGGSNTRRAVAGFQRRHDLDASGELDAATWTALNADPAAALIEITLTDADVAGPFATLPSDMMARAELPALGYESVAEALGEKYHLSPALLASLNAGKTFTAGTVMTVPNVVDVAPLAKASKVVVDKSDSTVSVMDAAGAVIALFPASTGSKHDPLPMGDWKIEGVGRNPVFKYNPKLFWDADPTHAKATLPAGPNNPVGTVWVDLSKPHYGIHGTPEPSKIGKSESHGCIRLTNWSANALAQSVSPGTPALLQP